MKKTIKKKVKSITDEQIKNASCQFKMLIQNSMFIIHEDRNTLLTLTPKMCTELSITDIKTIQKLFDKYTNVLNKIELGTI